ncbi:adenylate/guanylate cyclase domain-containing protein [Leptospira sp. GIMC2001]|uniref:adenylate/guanylate cyclase domain-containing protein n=1 Tax=Leptospira sp. GIMC2001 TaxID=1513297 RepID=UPI00234A1220|nr:adenylate/guanylate cyclase domain-containing protein [Leptospira sp. GIMC2001]WCL48467.1 adenylate/guanylate cyclase domain-containing protein [Leptospira sp. GIMC2001]
MILSRIKNLFLKQTGWVLVIFPSIIVEIIGIVIFWGVNTLIASYLLGRESVPTNGFVILILDFLFLVFCIVYLIPVIRLQKLYYDKRINNQSTEISIASLQIAKNRIYNYPLVLVPAIYILWASQLALLVSFDTEGYPLIPAITISLISTVLAAVICYYSVDILIRFLYVPYWFDNGDMRVTRKIFFKPSLIQRFFDLFLVNALLPAISISGTVFLALKYGSNDPGLIERLFYTTIGISLAYWTFGFPFLLLTAATIIKPINELSKAAKQIANEDYAINMNVNSDDQLGKLQVIMNRVGKELEEKSVIKTLFGHYVSPVVRDLILGGKINTEGEKIEAVILFSDIRSFTAITEKFPPEKVVNLLNIHFSKLVSAISDNQGFVDKFIGDAMMAVFDAQLCSNNHKLYAFNAVTQILEGMQETNRLVEASGMPRFEIGLGMACGDVIRGNVGAAERKELTVIGDPVNTASRLETLTKSVGRTVVASLNSLDIDISKLHTLDVLNLDPISVRGKSEMVDVIAFSLKKPF